MGRLQSTKNKMLLVLAVVLAVAAGGAYAAQNLPDKTQQPKKPTSQTAVPVEPAVKIEADKVSYPGIEGKNALELLKTHAKVETKPSSLGEYVVSVNGNDGGGTKYWLFYVNDKQASVGADAYATKNTDKVEWRLE